MLLNQKKYKFEIESNKIIFNERRKNKGNKGL